MKQSKCSYYSSLILISITVIAGCGKSSEKVETAAVNASEPIPQKAVELTLAPKVVQAQSSRESAPLTKLTEKLPTLTFSPKTSDLLKNEIATNYRLVEEKTKAITSTMDSGDSEQSALLGQVMSALKNSNYLKSLEILYTLDQYQLSPEQSDLFRELKTAAEIFTLGQEFSNSSPTVQGDIGKIIFGIKSQDTLTVVDGLKGIYHKAQLTEPQKQLVGTMVDKYAPQLKDAAGLLKNKLKF